MATVLKVIAACHEFECHVSPIGCGMISVNIFEVVHPTRKFFRTKWRDEGAFWIDDYDTIQEGVKVCVQHYINKNRTEFERANKWKEFENSLK